mmetsp:Transcript_17442/g.50826  ORF Transcript_17442/g.50826 Transcript_17442/m.50826 type:complete len:270 (+) Transcript_17442:2075-2884(+)
MGTSPIRRRALASVAAASEAGGTTATVAATGREDDAAAHRPHAVSTNVATKGREDDAAAHRPLSAAATTVTTAVVTATMIAIITAIATTTTEEAEDDDPATKRTPSIRRPNPSAGTANTTRPSRCASAPSRYGWRGRGTSSPEEARAAIRGILVPPPPAAGEGGGAKRTRSTSPGRCGIWRTCTGNGGRSNRPECCTTRPWAYIGGTDWGTIIRTSRRSFGIRKSWRGRRAGTAEAAVRWREARCVRVKRDGGLGRNLPWQHIIDPRPR